MLNSKVGKKAKLLADILFMGKSVRHLGGVCVCVCVCVSVCVCWGCLHMCSCFGKTPHRNILMFECLVSLRSCQDQRMGNVEGEKQK